MAQISLIEDIENEINNIGNEIENIKIKRSSENTDMIIKQHIISVSTLSSQLVYDNRLNNDLMEFQNVTNKIHEMVEQQKKDTDNIISIAEKQLNITKNLQKNLNEVKEKLEFTNILSTYRDWVGEFLREVVHKMKFKSLDEFVQTLHNIGFFEENEDEENDEENEDEESEDEKSEVIENVDQEDEEDEEQEEDDRILAELEKILEKVELTLSDFKELLKMRDLSNNTFHNTDSNQTPKEVITQLQNTDFPEDIAHVKAPLKKALDALTLWTKNKKRRNKRKNINKSNK